MTTNHLRSVCILLMLFVLGAINIAQANDNNKNALAKAQYMLRQVSSEKTQLEAEITKIKKEKEDLQKELDNVKKDHKKILSDVTYHQQQLNAATEEKNDLIDNIQVEKEKLEAMNKENERLLEKLDAQTNNFQICYTNNKKLYEINQEILGKYQEKGFWDALSQKEPLTALGKVQVENLIQDYQYKMDGLEINIVKEPNTASTR